MIKILNKIIEKLMMGPMGVKTVKKGSETVYERQGAYFYLRLES